MNVLIKSLTVVNVVFLPLAVISGMGGMSEFSRFLDVQNIDFATGYLLFTCGDRRARRRTCGWLSARGSNGVWAARQGYPSTDSCGR